ncbi:MAG: TonB-dependent receptor [Dysgonamonadaceae bacterium]|jgi:outer membrane receptor protein involved in Fe transport|nr:TonB-dependent receptor [Dysgonamonadaceae bacterium]
MKKVLSLIILSLLMGQQLLFANVENESESVSDTLKSYALKEVVVSSSSKETNNLRALPASVSILTPSQIEGLKVNTIKDLSMIVPNFFIPDYGSKLSTPVYIRGIGERAAGQTIGLYVDDMPYMDKTTFDFNLTDIQRIEVLRGPQGTLYGRNAMGGIVNIYTRSPLDYAHRTNVMLSGGNYGLKQAKLTESYRVNEKVGMSVSGYYDENDGFFTNQYTGKKADDLKAAGGRFRLDWKASNKLKFQWVANYDYSDQGAFPYGEYKDGNIADPNYNSEGRYFREVVGTGLNVSYETEHFLLTSSTGYQHFNDDMKMDTDYSPDSLFWLNQKQRQHSFSEEINIKSNNNNNYQWSFGIMGFASDLRTDVLTAIGQQALQSIFESVIPPPMIVLATDKETPIPGVFKTPTYGGAVFHQSTYNNLFVEGLSLTAGIRLDYEKTKLDYNTSATMNLDIIPPRGPIVSAPISTNPIGSGSTSFTEWLPKIALKYEIDPQRYVYASVAKGYKVGGYNVQVFADIVRNIVMEKGMQLRNPSNEPLEMETQEAILAETSYKPELSWNYELGFKGELIKDFLYAELAGFYIDVRDVQLTQMATMGRIVNNAAGAESFGGEVSLTAYLSENFSLTANYGYTHATFKNDTLYNGNFVPFAPQNTLSLTAAYNKNFNKKWIDSFNLQVWYNAAGRIYWTEANDVYQDFYGVLNARVSLSKGNFGLAFWMKNILNEKYATFHFESMGNKLAQRGKPMQLGIDLSFRF